MPDPEAMTATVRAYIEAFDSTDPAAARDLFAPDAVVEDPVGSTPHKGHDAIHAQYAKAMETGAKLQLDGAVRIAGNAAAVPLSIKVEIDGAPARVDAIDVFEFDEAGKIRSMRAYFGPTNFHSGADGHA